MCIGAVVPAITAMLSTTGGALALGGGLLSGLSGASGRMTEARNSEAAAVVADNRAHQARETGIDQFRSVTREIARVSGAQRAAAAESGLATTGSVGDVMDQSISEADLDLQAIRYSTGQNVWAAKTDAETNRRNARRARASAPIAFLSPVMNSFARLA